MVPQYSSTPPVPRDFQDPFVSSEAKQRQTSQEITSALGSYTIFPGEAPRSRFQDCFGDCCSAIKCFFTALCCCCKTKSRPLDNDLLGTIPPPRIAASDKPKSVKQVDQL